MALIGKTQHDSRPNDHKYQSSKIKTPMVFSMSKFLTCVVKRYKWQLQNQAHKHIQSFTQQEQKLEIAIVRQNS